MYKKKKKPIVDEVPIKFKSTGVKSIDEILVKSNEVVKESEKLRMKIQSSISEVKY